MSKFCGKCGTKLDENTGLCPNCDKKSTKYDDNFSYYSEADFNNNYDENDRKKSVRKKVLIATLVTVCIALIITAIILICSIFNTKNYKTDKNESTSKISEKYAYSESVTKTENTESEIETTKSFQSDASSDNRNSSKHNYDNSKIIETSQPYTENNKVNTTVAESSYANDYSQYVGKWDIVYPNGNGAALWVDITDVKENKMTFELGRTSPNYSHIAMTESITAEINFNNEVNFTFTDSFSNNGTGYMKLNDDNIYLKTEISKTNQPYIYALFADDTLTKSTEWT